MTAVLLIGTAGAAGGTRVARVEMPSGVIAVSLAAPVPFDRDPQLDLFTMRSDGSGKRLVAGGKATHEFEAAWAPDRRRLAFTRLALTGGRIVTDAATVWVTNSDGSRPRKLARGRSPSWSPDGKRLAFVKDGFVYVLVLASGKARRVVRGHSPSWSGRGLIAFVRGGNPDDFFAEAAVWTVRADGTRARKLLRGSAVFRPPSEPDPEVYDLAASGPVWSPDGRRIAFFNEYSWAAPGLPDDPWELQIHVARADGRERQSLNCEPRPTDELVPSRYKLTWSADGEWVVVTDHDDEDQRPRLILCSTTDPTVSMTSLPLERRGYYAGTPAWRP